MKVQCDLCREIVVAELAVVGDAIEVRCPACTKTFTVAASRKVEPPVRRVEGALTCPKCGDAQPEAKACRTCGLLAERMSTYQPPATEAPPALAEAWTALESRWEDADAHAAFLQQVTAADAYPWAAQRYRAAARERPDDKLAAEQLARIARMTEVSMRTAATRRADPQPQPYKNVTLVLGSLIVLMILATMLAVLGPAFFGQDEEPSAKPQKTQPAKPRPAKQRK